MESLIQPMIWSSVANMRRMAVWRTIQLSPLIPQRSPGRRSPAAGNQVAYLTKKVGKLKRKLKKAESKKLAKKGARDLLDSDSNSD